MIDKSQIISDLHRVRQQGPLVHNITNYVVMNTTANALLSIGASPVMAHATEEVADMAAIASALVINTGTLSSPWVDAMHKAMESARKHQVPIVFDPVGVGATPYRRQTAQELFGTAMPDIIRGNASEILALYSEDAKSKGVDATHDSSSAVKAAETLTQNHGSVIVISGETDYIVSADRTETITNGAAMMGRVTGMGCTASALTGAFAAVNSDFTEAATSAMAVMGISGELAAQRASGPGSLQLRLLDTLYSIGEAEITNNFKSANIDA